MRIHTSVAAIVAAALLPVASARAPQSDPASWSRGEKEKYLLNAKIVSEKDTGEGITNSTRAKLQSDLGTHDAHVQTIDEYKARFEGQMGTEMNFKDTYKFNIAAYILDRILDLNMIPVTVERKVRGKRASLTWWIDNVLMTEKQRLHDKADPPPAVREKWNRQMHIVRVFDQLISNTDRNVGNIVITKNWDLWMIDHTRAFRIHHDLREAKNLVMCDRALLVSMRGLNKQDLKQRMGNYLTGLEIDGLLARRDKIVKFFEDKMAREGEAEVLYDYLAERRQSNP